MLSISPLPRFSLRRTALAALLAVVGWAGVVRAQPDAVDALRQALKMTGSQPEVRAEAMQRAVDALHGIPDLRRALVLPEWRDEDIDAPVAEIDRRLRTAVQRKFEQEVRSLLSRGDATSRVAVADMLADIGVSVHGVGSAKSLAHCFSSDLARLIAEGTPPVRTAAARALGQINPDLSVAVPALSGMLGAAEESQRQAAAASLSSLMQVAGRLAARGHDPSAVAGSRRDFVAVGRAVLPVVSRALSDASPLVRSKGIETIGWAVAGANTLVPERQAPEIIGAEPDFGELKEEQAEWQPLLVALKDLGPALPRALGDPDPNVRALTRRACEVLAELHLRLEKQKAHLPVAGVPGENDPLLAALRPALLTLAEGITDPDPRVRKSTLNVLEMLGPTAVPAAPALVKALGDPDRFIRWSAARTLGNIAPQAAAQAVPALVAMLSDPDGDLRLAAVAALEHYGSAALPAVPALVQTLRPDEAVELRVAVIHVLEQIGTPCAPVAVPALGNALTDADPRIRQAAARGLGRFGGAARDAVEALRAARTDSSMDVQQAATEALLQIAEPANSPAPKD
jgi:HEAT repeat protein